MPTYEYEALNSSGLILKDVITADTPRDARERLRRRGMHVTSIAIARELDESRQKSVVLSFSAKAARSELVLAQSGHSLE
jgi:type II secretory pathway component PulF